MAVVLTTYGQKSWSKSTVGLWTPPANYYVALCTDMPDESIDGTSLATLEPSDPGVYGRQPLPSGGVGWVEYGGGVGNLAPLTWTPATADWGVIARWALCDAATAGNVFCAGDLPESWRVLPGLQVVLEEGAIILSAQSPPETIVT